MLTLVASCGSLQLRRAAPDPPSTFQRRVIKIWAEPSPNFDRNALLEGCNVWLVKGVSCELVDQDWKAHIRVYDDPKAECKTDGDSSYALAVAYEGGKIVMMTPCMRKWLGFGGIRREMFQTVFSHEVGHELGIWDHVPESCDPKDLKPRKVKVDGKTNTYTQVIKVHPNGQPICGQALMNPAYEPGVDVPTEIDALAFDVRDLTNSVRYRQGGQPVPDGQAICVFTAE
jgi:hypothetical protein